MRILVTGASGFVGRALIPALLARGFDVTATTRSDRIDADWRARVRTITVADLSPQTDWTDALAGVHAVIHLAARVHVMEETAADPLGAFRLANVDGTLALAEQAKAAGIKRFVYLSSIKVNGEATTAAPFRAEDTPKPEDPYGVSKAEAEAKLFALDGIEAVAVRPPLVYGPGVKGNFRTLLSVLSKRWPLPLGWTGNQRSLISVTNLVDILARLVDADSVAGRAFVVCDGDDISTTTLLRKAARALGTRAVLVPIPPVLLRLGAALLGRQAAADRLLGSLQIDDSALRQALGWTPPQSLDDGLKDTAQAFRDQ